LKLFDFEEERIRREISKHSAKRVFLQLPEGLKPEALRLSKIIDKTGAVPIVSADPCYGACDIAIGEAESMGADLIIHFGHSKLVKHERVPTVYVEARAVVGIDEIVQDALPLIDRWQRIGLATTVQHVQALDGTREILTRAGKTVMIGDAGHLSYPGQVLGCDYTNAKSIAKDVDAFLFIGGGKFHALGIALSTSKPTIVADPYDQRAYSVDEEADKIRKQRWASISRAEKAKVFAVIVGLKPAQKHLELALDMKRMLEESRRTVILLAAREVTPEVLMEFPSVEAYVNTACPRISLDDTAKFKMPVLTFNETLVLIGKLTWEELCRRGLFENST
jgi:2-(3-amino-3-carboxypropyl)histidine synthase